MTVGETGPARGIGTPAASSPSDGSAEAAPSCRSIPSIRRADRDVRRLFSLSFASSRAIAMTAVAATLSRSACCWAGLTVYVAFLLTQAANAADEQGGLGLSTEPDPISAATPADPSLIPPPGTPTPYGPLPPPAPPFRDSIYGAHANPGPPGSPGYLHPHFPEYQTRYGIWYQPRSFWEPTREVYRPQPFRPRGWGNLFVDDPCRHDRMDYNRYVVKDLPSRYGPSYYPLYQPPSECVIFRPERKYVPPVYGSAE